LLEDVGIRVMVLNAYYKTDRTVTRQCSHNFSRAGQDTDHIKVVSSQGHIV